MEYASGAQGPDLHPKLVSRGSDTLWLPPHLILHPTSLLARWWVRREGEEGGREPTCMRGSPDLGSSCSSND